MARVKGAPLAVLAAGGTGGHLFPAQALAEELLARGWRVVLATDARGVRWASGFPEAVERWLFSAATPARDGRARTALVLARGILSATVRMGLRRPAVVAGFGGYPSIPALAAAWVLRVPRLIHEQNAVLGRVNRLFAPRVHAVACSFAGVAAEVHGAVHTGNPVRKAIREKAGAPYIPPGDYPLSILVLGGSQGARILSEVVPAGLALLPADLRRRLRVQHQARPEDARAVEAFYSEAGLRAEVAPFFPDVARRMAEAQLVIARAGASTVAELAVVGRPAILVPFAAALADEQSANARALVEAGGAIALAEASLSPATLAEQVLSILRDPPRAEQMAKEALAVGRPDAVQALADLVERVAGR